MPFLLWFNFLAGFAYVIAGAGLWLRHRWAVWLAVVIAAATAFALAAFGAHGYAGGAYEMRTVIAMSFRTLVWVAIAAISWHGLSRGQPAISARDIEMNLKKHSRHRCCGSVWHWSPAPWPRRLPQRKIMTAVSS